jgi:hypothetical protein
MHFIPALESRPRKGMGRAFIEQAAYIQIARERLEKIR